MTTHGNPTRGNPNAKRLSFTLDHDEKGKLKKRKHGKPKVVRLALTLGHDETREPNTGKPGKSRVKRLAFSLGHDETGKQTGAKGEKAMPKQGTQKKDPKGWLFPWAMAKKGKPEKRKRGKLQVKRLRLAFLGCHDETWTNKYPFGNWMALVDD